jgi:N-acyl-D-aspartate/D-glutamate deacylase
MDLDVVIQNGNIFLGAQNCDIGIKNGKIIALQPGIEVDERVTVIDAMNKIVIPGYDC